MNTSSSNLPCLSPRNSQRFRPIADPFKPLRSFSPSIPTLSHNSSSSSRRSQKMPCLVAVTAKLKGCSSQKSLTPSSNRPKNPATALDLCLKQCNKRIEDAIKVSKIPHNADLVDFTFGLQDN